MAEEGLAGLPPRPLLDKMGQHTVDTCELFFEDRCACPATNLLGPDEGQGFAS
jgi:acyl-CoA dehydrogenase